VWAWEWVGWVSVAHSRRISLQDRGIRYSLPLVVPLFDRGVVGVGGDGEERGGEHAEGDVPVPGVVAADLVVVQTGLVFGELESFLHSPAGSGNADEFGERHWCAGTADVVGQLCGLGDRVGLEYSM
jgi:hypothetical protein